MSKRLQMARWKQSAAIASITRQGMPAGAVPLNLAILCDGMTLEAWEAEAVSCLFESGFVVPRLVIVGDAAARPELPKNRDVKLREFVVRSFQTLCRVRAIRRVDAAHFFASIPTVRCTPAIATAITDAGIDVILKLGSPSVDASIVSLTRHGVWGISRTAEAAYEGGIPGFWEVVNGHSVTGGRLYRLTGDEGEAVVLRAGWVNTGSIPGRSLDVISFECARWPTYAVAEIVNGARELETQGAWRSRPPQRVPTWLDLMRYFMATAKRLARRVRDLSFVEEWHVGVIALPIEKIMAGEPLKDVRWLPSGRDVWYADPCARLSNGKLDVLVEKMPLIRGRIETKAVIASVALDEAGWGTPVTALDTGSHASYPYLIETDGKIFMLPETSELNEVGLYEPTDFPNGWKRVGVVLPGIPATDATVFEHRGKWWLMCTTRDASAETLLAFYADSLMGPWRGHRRNPLKIDVRGARPAGRPFEIAGTLYRPSQDCSQTYGGRIVVQRICELDPERWLEEPAFEIEPEPTWPYNKGMHTISVAGDRCVIDAKRLRR